MSVKKVELLKMSEINDDDTYYLIPKGIADFIHNYSPYDLADPKQLIWGTSLDKQHIDELKSSKGILHDHNDSEWKIPFHVTIGSYTNDLQLQLISNYNFKIFHSVMEVTKYAEENNLEIASEASAMFY